MRVLSKQISGLGNQLFQYAAGLYFAERYGARLAIVQEPVAGALSHGLYHRPFLLSKFTITAPVHLRNRFDEQMLTMSPRFPALRHVLKAAGRIVVRHETPQQRYHFVEDLQLPFAVQTLYLSGYWQAHQYADAVASSLRKQLCFREPAIGHNRSMLERIKAASISISLHIRRGDYTLAAENNIALPLGYYRQAIQQMCERFKDPTFFIFSDDLEFACKNLPIGTRQVLVEGNDDFSSHEDLRLMSACQHHIIANSSFSWWGAWLNPSPEKVVIAPRHWLLSQESAWPDLLPPDWYTLDSLRVL